jgi:long-chain acyl-CoA synthetase
MRTFIDALRRGVSVAPGRDAVVDGGTHLTFLELEDRARRLTAAIRGLGLEPGDRIALLLANGHRYIECYVALPAAGFVIVPLNSRLSEAELRYILVDAGARVLVTDRVTGVDDVVERVVRVPDEYDDLVAATPGAAAVTADVAEDSLAGLFYTGGTTGPAKGVMLTHRSLIANMWNTLVHTGLSPDDRFLVIAPMFHAAGTVAVLACLALGASEVTIPAFDPALVLDTIEAEQATVTLAVPTMLVALIEEQRRHRRDTSSLRLICHGASPIAVETLRRCREAFPTAALTHLYGATETAPLATTLADEHLHLDGPLARSCGQAVVGVEIAIEGVDGTAADPGDVGEVVIRGPNLMTGYWNKPDETSAALRDGWYHSGDLGYVDDRGYLFLVDRAKDMIITGGENVYSTEVEQALMTHPAVLECAVYGIPHETWGEAVAASVVLTETVPVDELQDHCRGLIAGFKVPRHIDTVDTLPKSAAGKILKRELREPYWAGRDVRVGGS